MTVFKADIMPRDVWDVLVGLPIAGLSLAAFLVYGVGLYFLTNSVVAALVIYIATLPLTLLFHVRYLVIREDGLLFNRIFGSPRNLPWSEILDVAPAPRSEVVLQGWYWPLPPFCREASFSLSACGHYRIRFKGGHCYFPPRDAALFNRYIEAAGKCVSQPVV